MVNTLTFWRGNSLVVEFQNEEAQRDYLRWAKAQTGFVDSVRRAMEDKFGLEDVPMWRLLCANEPVDPTSALGQARAFIAD